MASEMPVICTTAGGICVPLESAMRRTCARATVEPTPTLPVVRGWLHEIMGLLYVIHNRRLLSMLDSFRRNAPLRR